MNHGSWLSVIKSSDQGKKESKAWAVLLPHFLLHMREEQEKLRGSLTVHPFGAGMYKAHGSGKASSPFVPSGWVKGNPSLLQLCTSSGTQKFPSQPSSKNYSAVTWIFLHMSAEQHQMD